MGNNNTHLFIGMGVSEKNINIYHRLKEKSNTWNKTELEFNIDFESKTGFFYLYSYPPYERVNL